MKLFRRLLSVMLIMSVFFVAGLFVGCGGKGDALSGSMKIVLAPAGAEVVVFDVNLEDFTDKDHVMDVIEALKKDGKICYESEDSQYGMFLKKLGNKVNGEDNYILAPTGYQYIEILTSVEKDKTEVKSDADWQPTTKNYNGVEVVSSMQGISSMTICDGAVIYFWVNG